MRFSASATLSRAFAPPRLRASATASQRLRAPLPRASRPAPRASESGFTLAGVLIILTVISVFVAYTVPRQWSTIMQRERDQQAIYAMKQYARAIDAWQAAHNGLPTTMEQLQKARQPRVLRGFSGGYPDPLTGEMDWILIPPGQGGQPIARTGSTGPIGGGFGFFGGSGSQGSTGPTGSTGGTGATTSKDYVGPFIGVRPNKTGPSFIELNGAKNYEQWTYTLTDLTTEKQARLNALNFFK